MHADDDPGIHGRWVPPQWMLGAMGMHCSGGLCLLRHMLLQCGMDEKVRHLSQALTLHAMPLSMQEEVRPVPNTSRPVWRHALLEPWGTTSHACRHCAAKANGETDEEQGSGRLLRLETWWARLSQPYLVGNTVVGNPDGDGIELVRHLEVLKHAQPCTSCCESLRRHASYQHMSHAAVW